MHSNLCVFLFVACAFGVTFKRVTFNHSYPCDSLVKKITNNVAGTRDLVGRTLAHSASASHC